MHDRDTWLYNHKDQMDPVRYEEMKQKDKELEARLKVLETQGAQKDPSYIPPGVERDLMYSDEYVKSAYVEKTKSGFPWIWVFVSLLVVTGMAYFVFIRKWNNGI